MLDNPLAGIQLRQHARLPVDFALTYVRDGDPAVKPGRARDIGGGGIYFESQESLPKASSVKIWFELGRGTTIEVDGQVASSSRDPANDVHGHRVAFIKLPDPVRDTIVAYIFDAWRTALMEHK
jgi:hypothetical protein